MLNRALRDEGGMTLIEVIIAISLTVVLGALVVGSMAQGGRTAQRNHHRITALTELQSAAHRMARELRAANPVTAADLRTVTVSIRRSNQSVSFMYRLVVDTASTYRLEEVRTIGAASTTFVLARGLQAGSLTLQYFNSSGGAISTPVIAANRPLIQTIKVTLTRFIPSNTQPMTLETTVELRNQA